MKNDELNTENGNASKKAIISSTLIILFFIMLVVLYFTSNAPDTKETAKYEIPENAVEISPDIALKVVYPFNTPKIKFYAYSDNTAAELYSFVYLINNLDISSCDFIIYDNDERSTFTLEELNNSKEFTDIPLPKSWIDFYNDNDFADGNVSLRSFVSISDSRKIEENIDTFISNNELSKSATTNNGLGNETSIDDDKNLESESTDESSENEPNLTTNYLKTKEYELDGEKIAISLTESDCEYRILVLADAANEEKASLILATFVADLKKINSIDGFDISIFCNDLLVTYLTTETGYIIGGTNTDGTTVLTTPDWIVSDFALSTDEINNLASQIDQFLIDFRDTEQ